jgi:hypothetical protein
MNTILKCLACLLTAGISHVHAQELYVQYGTLTTSGTGKLIIEGGSLASNTSIDGTVVLKNAYNPFGLYASNNINMNLSGGPVTGPHSIKNLEIDNPAGVQLSGSVKIDNQLVFTNGPVLINNHNLTFKNGSSAPGSYVNNKGVITNGTGYCEYEMNTNNMNDGFLFPVCYVDSVQVPPVGSGIIYTRPAPIYLSNSGGTLSTGTPTLRAQVKFGRSPNIPARAESYVSAYWPVRKSGITGGNLTGTGYYGYTPSTTLPDFTGTENDIVGFGYNNADWLLTGNGENPTDNYVTGTINTTAGEIFGMNKFVYLKAKALLQGAYASGGLMNDHLRTGTGGNLIPITDPYRTAPYNAVFTHVNNSMPEVANAAVFADQTNPNDNIVDWVFVEVRNAVTSGSTLLQTRSALIQKDGDIVDVDGKSQLYFKNLIEGNYTVTIRHRNHLAMSTNNAGNRYTRMSNLSYLYNFDFTTADAINLLGSGGGTNTSNYNITGGYNMLFGGNANAVLNNNKISYSGSVNDASYIIGPALNGPSNVLGVPNGVYHWADVNMNRRLDASGGSSDPSFILLESLGGFPGSTRTELKPQ